MNAYINKLHISMADAIVISTNVLITYTITCEVRWCNINTYVPQNRFWMRLEWTTWWVVPGSLMENRLLQSSVVRSTQKKPSDPRPVNSSKLTKGEVTTDGQAHSYSHNEQIARELLFLKNRMTLARIWQYCVSSCLVFNLRYEEERSEDWEAFYKHRLWYKGKTKIKDRWSEQYLQTMRWVQKGCSCLSIAISY